MKDLITAVLTTETRVDSVPEMGESTELAEIVRRYEAPPVQPPLNWHWLFCRVSLDPPVIGPNQVVPLSSSR